MPRTYVTCCARQKAVPGIGSCAEVSEVSRPSAALGPALDPRFVGRASAKAHLDAHGHWLGKAEQEYDEQGEGKHANKAMQGKTAQSIIADVERRTRTGIRALRGFESAPSTVWRLVVSCSLNLRVDGSIVSPWHHFGRWTLRSRHRQLDDRQQVRLIAHGNDGSRWHRAAFPDGRRLHKRSVAQTVEMA
jgi:hypothetical protein